MDTSPMSARADKQRGNSNFVEARLEISGLSLLFLADRPCRLQRKPPPGYAPPNGHMRRLQSRGTRVPPPDGKKFRTKLPFELAANSAPAGVNTVIAAGLRRCEDRRPDPHSMRREPAAKPSVALR
jgi:hypothetical protein